MKTFISQLLVLGLSAGIAFADGGIPVDRKSHTVTVPHTLLTLTDSQREEIDVAGTVTLTSEQWKELRIIGADCRSGSTSWCWKLMMTAAVIWQGPFMASSSTAGRWRSPMAN